MESIDADHLASLSGDGLYSYIATSKHSKPFHDFAETSVKNIIGESKNPYMDAVSGRHHRWKHGHDPIDVMGFAKDPSGKGMRGLRHLLTDLPTKDGLPIPGLSKEYLGGSIKTFLDEMGVKNSVKWLNMNGFDYLFGGLSMLESGHDMSQALSSEEIDFTWETAFDTFGEGTIEIYFGLQTFNPVLLASGVTEYTAGSIMLYKDIERDNLPVYEKILDNLPTQTELVTALGFYMMISSLKNYVSYANGNSTGVEFTKKSIIDISASLGTFAITKSLITTLSIGGVTGGMLLPLLIGGGTSLLLREVFTLAFPNNRILITENELWEQSPFQYDSPWSKNPFDKNNVWQDNIFDNGNIWQQDVFKTK